MDYVEDLFNSDYYEILTSVSELKLLIVGRDPYPKGAINIAMCKADWKEMSDKRNSGRTVLISLFGKSYDEVIKSYETPIELFFDLAKNGIGFFNASLEKLDTQSLMIIRPDQLINFYRSLFEKTKRVLLCGDASKMFKGHINILDFSNITLVPHPAPQSRNKLLDKQKWDNIWSEGKLSNYLNP